MIAKRQDGWSGKGQVWLIELHTNTILDLSWKLYADWRSLSCAMNAKEIQKAFVFNAQLHTNVVMRSWDFVNNIVMRTTL